MTTKNLFAAILFGMSVMPGCSGNTEVFITNYPTHVELYGSAFVDIVTTCTFTNPYNPDDIKVDAEVRLPDGKKLYIPCFYMRGDSSNAQWQARFTPRASGTCEIKIVVTKGLKVWNSESKSIEVTPSEKKGFLSADSTNAYLWQFDNGSHFRGVGFNICWEFEPKWGNAKKYTYENYFDAMASNNANFVRTWICPWNLPIEWTAVPKYKLLLDEYNDLSKLYQHSDGLHIHAGQTPVTQTDTGQLVFTGKYDHYVVYKIDTLRKTKIMIYFRNRLTPNDIEIQYSADNTTYFKVPAAFSDSWDVDSEWKRIFLFSTDTLPQVAHYVKYLFKSSLNNDDIKIAGIHINYGNTQQMADCNGLGWYAQKNSERLDEVLQYAERKGIYLMLTLGYHGQFNPIMDSWGVNDEWQRNPYSVKNGGPCQQPADFFSNPEAKRMYKHYLRYFVARWGYSPALAVWELWNEIDLAMRAQQVPPATMAQWHNEMANYLKSVDPYNHFVSTSLCCMNVDGLWNAPAIDFTQIHRYEPSANIIDRTLDYIATYKKPHIIGEFAIGWKGPGNDYPVDAYIDDFHNGMWRGLFSPVAVLPMSWWWDTYMDMNQYFHFQTIGNILNEQMRSGGTFESTKLTVSSGIEAYELMSGNLLIAWIKNLKADTELNNLTIPVKTDGTYDVQITDTWSNSPLDHQQLESKQGYITLPAISIAKNKDVVILLKRKVN